MLVKISLIYNVKIFFIKKGLNDVYYFRDYHGDRLMLGGGKRLDFN